MISEDVLQAALDAARRAGADYAEARAERRLETGARARNGAVQGLSEQADMGWGVQVAVGGGWGFASTPATDPAAITATAEEAMRLARASATRRQTALDLSLMPTERGSYRTTVAH